MKTSNIIKVVGGIALLGGVAYVAYKYLTPRKEDKTKEQGVLFTEITLLDPSGVRVVGAGQDITAKVVFKNIASTSIAPRFRLPIWESRGWPHTPIGDKSSDWQRTPVVQPGDTIEFNVVQRVPSNWGAGLGVSVRLDMEGVGTVRNWDAYFTVGEAAIFEFADDGHYVLNYGWDAYWACATRSLRHKGGAIRVWVGFGILPSLAAWDTSVSPWRIDPYFLNNLAAYGSDVWKGAWSDWGDDEEWSPWYEQTTRNYYGEPGCDFWPAGFDPRAMYFPIWVVQRESPVDRRNRNEPPLMDDAVVAVNVDGIFHFGESGVIV